MVNTIELIQTMKDYAEDNNVPIITDEGINYIRNYIKENNIKSILEIGAAIGYSSILMALTDEDITITTVERDEKRYLEAVKNIKKFHLEERITLLYKDAFDVELDEQFDLVFIDAAKAQNTRFFEKFSKNLSKNGTIITDNMNFHGLVEDESKIESRNLRALIRKVKAYHEFLENNEDYKTTFLNVGDGLAVSKPI